MKNFSLLSLMAIAALSVSLSHAAAEFDTALILVPDTKYAFKQVGLDNYTKMEVIDGSESLEDDSNWKRCDAHFYKKQDSNGHVNFVIRTAGPSVADRAGKFGGQNKKPETSPKAAAVATAVSPLAPNNDDELDGEDEEKIRRQNDLLFLRDGDDADAKPSKGNVFATAYHHIKKANHYVRNAAREATAVMPEHGLVYSLDENEMRWNADLLCYELFENSGSKENPEWIAVKRYQLVGFAENGTANFKAIEEKADAEKHEDDFEVDSAGRADAVDSVSKPTRGNLLSRAWGHLARATQDATAVADQEEPAQRRQTITPEPLEDAEKQEIRAVAAASAVEPTVSAGDQGGPQKPDKKGQSWGAMFGGWATQIGSAVHEATAVQEESKTENDGGQETNIEDLD